MSQSHEVENFK